MGKQLGGDTAGTADPNQPTQHPVPYDVVLSNKTRGGWWEAVGEAAIAQKLAGHLPACGRWRVIAFESLGLVLIFSVLRSLDYLYLDLRVF